MTNISLKRKLPGINLKNQCGYALLVTAMFIMLGIALTGLIVVRSISFERKMQTQDLRSHQAFQAAEAGIEFGIAYLNVNKSTILIPASGNNSVIASYNNVLTNNVSFANNTTFTITYSNPVASDFTKILITSVGSADDGMATSTIKQIVRFSSLISLNAPAPLVTRGSVDLSGNLDIDNATTGLITGTTPTTIWSGGSVSLKGSASTYATGGIVSDKNAINVDVIQNDSNLSNMTSDAFFQTFFQTTMANAKNNSNVVYTNYVSTNYSTLLDGVVGKSIWIDQLGGSGSFSGNATIGSEASPVVLVINGPFTANGNTTVHGIMYFTDNWTNGGGGSLKVNGAVIVGGNIQSTGTPDITYSTDIMRNVSTGIGSFVKVPGTWRDF